MNEMAIDEAYAQQQEAALGTFFLEFDFRDQVDLMHVMVPPSIAKYPNRDVGVDGEQLTMFAPQSELEEFPNNVFLTADSMELAPHIDTVAMLDTGEPGIGGVHGHEAGNGMRSPGRVKDSGALGGAPMWLNDGAHAAGSEELYAWVPTPASFHNYYQKQLNPPLANGFAFKGISRFKHSVYHFGARLPGAELTRIPSKDDLSAHFVELPTRGILASPEQAALVVDLLARVDTRFLRRDGWSLDVISAHLNELEKARELLSASGLLSLELNDEEAAYWSEGVPPQQCTRGNTEFFDCGYNQNADPNSEGFVKAQIWEQFAYAETIFRSGLARSIALEFDFMDVTGDGVRTEPLVRMQAQQVARPVARLITALKQAGLYDRTLIAVYTLDGSRRPAANSYGDDGKGTILLAGGKVRGGYYGDIEITGDLPSGGHSYAFRPPHPRTGELLPPVVDWRDVSLRTKSGDVWRTVVEAMGIPEAEYVGRFHDALDEAQPLDFMLRT